MECEPMEQANPFQPAIEALEKELADIERQGNALLTTINLLRGKAGMPPRSSSLASDRKPNGEERSATVTTIRHDTFFGKKMSSSAREFLEMRKAANLGPARVKEIFDALKQGGYQFETKDDETAQASLRGMMSKYTVMFQRLPNSTWGLKSWYPDARKPRAAKSEMASAEAEEEEGAIPMPDETSATANAA